MTFPSDIKGNLELIGIVITIGTALLALNKKLRIWIKSKYKNHQDEKAAKKNMPVILSEIHSKVHDMDERLKTVEYEIKDPNSGGTIKGSLKLIKAEMEATNWLSPRPTFRTTSQGINVFVNEAYCQLCGASVDELLKLGWMSFVSDSEQADDYYHRWLLASKSLSQFASKLKIQDKTGEYRGEWIIRIRPLGPIESESSDNDYLWHGTLYPNDDSAKSYARLFGIPLVTS